MGTGVGGRLGGGILPELPAGVWRHYREGHLYEVLGYAVDANNEDRRVVVYVGLQLDGARPGPRLRVRTVEDFFADVDGKPRFQYVGPEWTPTANGAQAV